MTNKSEELIRDIQMELGIAAELLKKARDNQNECIKAATEGNFCDAITHFQAVAAYIEDAKQDEKDATKLIVKLIDQMRKDKYKEEIIFGVVESLISDFGLGA